MNYETLLFLYPSFCFLAFLHPLLSLCLLRRSFQFALPLPTTSTSFWPLDGNLLRQLAFPPSDLLCSLFLPFLIAFSESGHGGLKQCPVGRVKSL